MSKYQWDVITSTVLIVLFILVLGALIASAGWVGEPDTRFDGCNTCTRMPGQDLWSCTLIKCSPAPQPDCLATMEAAMKAVEPFIGPYFSACYGGDGCQKLYIEKLEKRITAMQQWTEAKRCWRTP